MGPAVTLRGLGDADPRVSGRIRDVAVSDDGMRIYVGTAAGGVWYSGDGGQTWLAVGAYTLGGDVSTMAPASTTLSVGALRVVFDAGGDPAADEVWVGTGEPDPRGTPRDFGILGNYSGIGILHAVGPVDTVTRTPDTDPWQHDAQPSGTYAGLRGQSVYAFAADPADRRAVVAATTAGLHRYDASAGPTTEPWSLVTVAAWDTALGAGGSGRVHVTDVVWADTPAGARLWVAVAGDATRPAVHGLWRSDNGLAGPFTRVDLTGVATDAQRATLRNLGLAAALSDATVLYALANGPRLWRVDGDTQVRRVLGVPAQLFGAAPNVDPGMSEYALAIAVDPAEPRRIVVGGGADDSSLTPGTFSASLYRLTLRTPAPVGNAPWHTDYAGGNTGDVTWIGEGVHADVHRVRWLPPGAAGPAATVHVVCDGGLFISGSAGDATTFVARTTGLGVTEAGYLDNHPTSDGAVLIGVQDNGTQLRIGDSVWRRPTDNSDGGGVAFDPAGSGRFIGQDSQNFWRDDANQFVQPSWRGTNVQAFITERNAARFYSNVAVTSGAVTQIAIATTRVWYSEHWFHTWWDGVAPGVYRTQAVTLPGGTDPRAGDANDAVTDVLPPGPIPPGTVDTWAPGIRAMRWAGPDRLYALLPGALYRLDRDQASRAWRRTRIMLRQVSVGAPAPAVSGATVPPEGSLNDIAVHDAGAGPHGSVYVATSNPLEPLWFFDGTAIWYPTDLGTLPATKPGAPGVRVPAYSVAVDQAEQGVVYVGTAVGVWRGQLALTAGVPDWDWTALVNGLPEAAVQDLSVATYPLAQGGQVRLLRAALQSRGAWECQLDTDLAEVTYLRVHPYDTHRSSPTGTADPLPPPQGADREWHLDWADVRARSFRDAAGRPTASPDGTQPGNFTWHASPDIRVRPAPGSASHPVPATLPWTHRPANKYDLWALQTALHAVDSLFVPDGRWTATFARRLRQFRHDHGLSNMAVVDAELWGNNLVTAGFWADPWASRSPTEADMVERVVHRPTPRPRVGTTPEVDAPTAAAASCALPAGPTGVEVCVHRRGLAPLGAGEVTVLLLRLQLPAAPATWSGLPALAVDGLGDAMAAVGAAGGPLSGVTLPGTWQVADQAVAVRRPPGPVGTAAPAVVSFSTDFTGAAGTQWLLLAVLAAGTGTPDLTGANLADLVLRSPNVAARSVEIV